LGFCPASLFYGKKPTFQDYLSVPSSESQGNPREEVRSLGAGAYTGVVSRGTIKKTIPGKKPKSL
jgi:hypothetical protein